ncbi:hypothetical protein YPPY63_1034, partial [Yersinia pestis PY-63]
MKYSHTKIIYPFDKARKFSLYFICIL